MLPKLLGSLKVTLLALLVFLPVVYAEEYAATVNSVQVKQSGKDGVVVDVYVNSKDKNIKPEISTRKHGDKKYVIDLMKVTKGNNVNKDASETSGLIENKGVHVGNTVGGAARVVLDLNNPNVQIKDVRYHFVDDKNPTPSKPIVDSKIKNQQPAKIVEAKQIKKVNQQQKIPKSKTTLTASAKSNDVIRKDNNASIKHESKKKSVQPIANSIIEHRVNTKQHLLVQKKDSNKHYVTEKVITPTNKNLNLDDKIISSAPVSNNVEYKSSSSQVQHLLHNEIKPIHQPPKHNQPVIKHKQVNEQKNISQKNQKSEAVNSKQNPEIAVSKKDPSEISLKNIPAPKLSENNSEHMIAQAVEEHHEPAPKTEPKHQSPKTEPQKKVNNTEQTPVNFENLSPEDGNIRTVNTDNQIVDPMGMIFTLIGALIVIVPLIFFVAWFVNLFYKGGNAINFGGLGSLDSSRFKIIASTSLGQGRSIHLVEIRGRQLVIGCTNTSINVLSEFTEFDEFVENESQEESKGLPAKQTQKFKKSRPPVGSFTELYKDYKGKIDKQDLEDEY